MALNIVSFWSDSLEKVRFPALTLAIILKDPHSSPGLCILLRCTVLCQYYKNIAKAHGKINGMFYSHVKVLWPLFSSWDQKMWQASGIKHRNILNCAITQTEILYHPCNTHKMKRGKDRVKFYYWEVSHWIARGPISTGYHFR